MSAEHKNPAIEVACGATPNYLPHLAVMLHSLLARTPHRPLRIWLMLDQPLRSDEHEKLLGMVAGAGGELRNLLIPKDLTSDFPTPRYFHPSIWYRILLPTLLPKLGRVLYLDVDMVITDDLAPLWETDLGSHLFAAVVAPFYRAQRSMRSSALEHLPVEKYLSSGVLLMNLEQMRRQNVVDQIREYGIAHPQDPCPEQDALNALFHEQCLYLHPRWNAQPIVFDTPPERLPFPIEQSRQARANPAIVHFSGISKPWHYLSKHPLRRLYFEHLRQTPWPVKPLQGRSKINRILRLFPDRWLYYLFPLLDKLRRKRADQGGLGAGDD